MNVTEWRTWLAEHGESETEVWLDIHPDLPYAVAVEHALCFGWIDSQAAGSRLRFTPRNPGSGWSRLNRDRAERMTAAGLMTPRGQVLIDTAKATGMWEVGEIVPDDLRALLDRNTTARANFDRFPPSSKRLILEWIATAKRPETRRRRLIQTVDLAEENIRANHPRSRSTATR
ncbi:YdeI family protein [Actinokineospora sp. UTMC 2448]|uniref:YdeI/OmpD-associated family protein n=1 Tax=Actinokineospora sp. UTMC 2448 TaxID=2268449 RepID=UPI0021649DC2|nr:YdeI/OmpD-associated family protein [Actinokineospora sp. UTMC 2448]UVS77473.1 hypothetical protein Actkin_01184 [Actinokineospora sp. UTMC 2448]